MLDRDRTIQMRSIDSNLSRYNSYHQGPRLYVIINGHYSSSDLTLLTLPRHLPCWPLIATWSDAPDRAMSPTHFKISEKSIFNSGKSLEIH